MATIRDTGSKSGRSALRWVRHGTERQGGTGWDHRLRKRTHIEDDALSAEAGRNERQFITSLYRGLEVLRAFRADDRSGLSNGDLAERTGLPNSTVSRLTYTLLQTGYLTYDAETGRYRMGVPVLSLGYACLSGMPIREAAQGYMQTLADSCGEGVMVALGGRDALTMTYVACAKSRSVVSLQLGVGSRISLARSAMGRAYLAGCSEEERAEALEDLERHADPDLWPSIRAGIDDARAQIEDRGFYANLEKWHTGVNAVAVPFRSQSDEPLMAFNLGGPASFLPQDRLIGEFGPRLVALAETMSHRVPRAR